MVYPKHDSRYLFIDVEEISCAVLRFYRCFWACAAALDALLAFPFLVYESTKKLTKRYVKGVR